jgi:hypothetical protein
VLLHANIARYEDTPLVDLCDTKNDKIQELLLGSRYGADGMTPTEFWAHRILKDNFYREGDAFDHLTFELLDDQCQPKTAMMNHREDGKTMRFKAHITRAACFRLMRYIMYIKATFEDASMEMDNVKNILMGNQFILEVFGNMRATEFNDVNKDFSKRAYFLCNPRNSSVRKEKRGEPFCFIHPRGAGQPVRGRNVYILGTTVRPDGIFGDDIDDEESVLNQFLREKNLAWWYDSVMRCTRQDVFPNAKTNRWDKPADAGHEWRPPFRIFCAGTFLHEKCLINELCNKNDWKHVRHPIGKAIEQPDGTVKYVSLRPKRISDAQLENEIKNRPRKLLDGFYREMLCMAGSKENRCWKEGMFKYLSAHPDKNIMEKILTDPQIIRVVTVDPSKLAAQHADLTGIMAWAVDPYKAEIYKLKAVGEHLTTSQIPERALQIAVEHNARIVAVERIGAEGYVDTNFINCASQRNLQVQFIWLGIGHTPKGDYGTGDDAVKRWRAQQILPYYEEGNVWHHDELAGGQMEQMYLDYPRPWDWCMTDCGGYIPAVMHEIGCVFHPQKKKHENVINFKALYDTNKMDAAIRDRSWCCV